MVKKAKDNARFGSRYGTKIRKRVTKVEKKYKEAMSQVAKEEGGE